MVGREGEEKASNKRGPAIRLELVDEEIRGQSAQDEGEQDEHVVHGERRQKREEQEPDRARVVGSGKDLHAWIECIDEMRVRGVLSQADGAAERPDVPDVPETVALANWFGKRPSHR